MFNSLLGETGGTIVQFILALIVVLALIFLVAWALKRYGKGRFGGHSGDQAELQVIDTLAIDQKRKLVLVRHGRLEHLLLVGGGSDAVVERSLMGGIPVAARLQANNAAEKPVEDNGLTRAAQRLRKTNKFSEAVARTGAAESDAELAPEPTELAPATKARTAAKTAGVVASGAALFGAAAATVASTAKAGASKAGASKATRASPPPSPEPAPEPPVQTPPTLVAQDERDALEQSLDEALSGSLLEEPKPVSPAEPAPLPDLAPAPVTASGVDDFELERELEAALELDTFELTDPADANAATAASGEGADLPPMPDLSGLTDDDPVPEPAEQPAADTSIEDRAQAAIAPALVTPAKMRLDTGPDFGSTVAAKVSEAAKTPRKAFDPLSLDSVRQAKAAEAKVAQAQDNQAEDSPAQADAAQAEPEPAPTPDPLPDFELELDNEAALENLTETPADIPVELSGRSDPPIPVQIPSRGPASNATTLAKEEDAQAEAGGEAGEDQALDISDMLKPDKSSADAPETPGAPVTPPVDTPSEASKSNDLDNEMRRLLGEMGEPEKT